VARKRQMSQKLGLEYGVNFLNRLVVLLFQRLVPSRSSRLCGGKVLPIDLVGPLLSRRTLPQMHLLLRVLPQVRLSSSRAGKIA
jgi:hypothetical protein